MTIRRFKAALVLAMAAAGVFAAQAWRPSLRLSDTRPKVELETLFPAQFGEWRVDRSLPVQLVSPDTRAMLDKIYNQTLSRTYVGPHGERIMLSVAYGGDQSDATRAHRPEVCYPAQGFQLMQSEIGSVPLSDHPLSVRRLVARQGARNEPITYWITVGDLITTSGMQQKLAQLSYSTRGYVPDGMLVRVSSIDPSAHAAWQIQQRFITDLAHHLPVAQATQVVGRTGA